MQLDVTDQASIDAAVQAVEASEPAARHPDQQRRHRSIAPIVEIAGRQVTGLLGPARHGRRSASPAASCRMMVARGGGGKIINMASSCARRAALVEPIYSATKAARDQADPRPWRTRLHQAWHQRQRASRPALVDAEHWGRPSKQLFRRIGTGGDSARSYLQSVADEHRADQAASARSRSCADFVVFLVLATRASLRRSAPPIYVDGGMLRTNLRRLSHDRYPLAREPRRSCPTASAGPATTAPTSRPASCISASAISTARTRPVYLDHLFNAGRDHDWAIVGAGVSPTT